MRRPNASSGRSRRVRSSDGGDTPTSIAEGWQADLHICGEWSVTVRFSNGTTNHASGEFAEIDAPNKIVMTRRFEEHPLLGTRETTITYRLEPIATGTRVTVRDEGFLGRSQAAYGNAEHWEKVLGWLDTYLTSESEGAASA